MCRDFPLQPVIACSDTFGVFHIFWFDTQPTIYVRLLCIFFVAAGPLTGTFNMSPISRHIAQCGYIADFLWLVHSFIGHPLERKNRVESIYIKLQLTRAQQNHCGEKHGPDVQSA